MAEGVAHYHLVSRACNRQFLFCKGRTKDKMAELGEALHHKEGLGDSGWILLDFGDIIINLFTKQQRDHYNIEKVWSDCDTVEYTAERK